MAWVSVLVVAVIPAMALGTPVTVNKWSQDPDVVDFVSEVCTMHSSHTRIPDVMGTLDKVQTCTESITEDMDKIKYSEVTRNEEYDDIIKKYCSPKLELRNCTYSALNIISWCGDKDSKTDVENARVILDLFIDYACHKEGERLAAFVKAGGLQCIEDNSKSLRRCGAFISDQIESDDDEDDSEENDTCEVFEHILNCALFSIRGCGATPVKIAKDLANHIRKVAGCNGSEETGLKVYNQWLESRSKSN